MQSKTLLNIQLLLDQNTACVVCYVGLSFKLAVVRLASLHKLSVCVGPVLAEELISKYFKFLTYQHRLILKRLEFVFKYFQVISLYPFKFEVKDLHTELNGCPVLNDGVSILFKPLLELGDVGGLEIASGCVLAKCCCVLNV